MNVYEHIDELPDVAKGSVVAIGNFDGVHRGHQALLQKALTLASQKNAPLCVLTFEPHTKRLFRPDEPADRITPAALKYERLIAAGVGHVLCLPFTWDLASLSAQDFITRILMAGVRASHVVIGQNFRFGQMRKGTPADIEAAGIPATCVDSQTDAQGVVISSSRIREYLRQGNVVEASDLLGWRWEIRGRVRKGDQRGRELGYPTANIALGETIHPAYGVYAAMVQIEGENHWRQAAVNIGIRPMFEIPEAQVESYILDYSGDLYGKTLRVRPLKRLRSEARFDTLTALKAQIAQDCENARAALARETGAS